MANDPIAATIAEQAGMKPEPSQDEVNKIKLGQRDPLKPKVQKQPEGPAADATAEQDEANRKALEALGPGSYQTRDATAQRRDKAKAE